MSYETPQVYPWRDPRAPANSPSLCIYFLNEPQVNKEFTQKTGEQTYDNVLVAYVAAKPQDKSNVAHEIRRTLPDGKVVMTQASYKYAEPLKHYDAGIQAESLGTPLKDLLDMNPGTIMSLKARGVATIEVLADLPDSAGHEMMGFYELRDRAKKHIEHRKENAPALRMEAIEAKHAEEVDALKRQLADLAAKFAERGDVPEEVPVVRRGPGRPRSNPEQEAA